MRKLHYKETMKLTPWSHTWRSKHLSWDLSSSQPSKGSLTYRAHIFSLHDVTHQDWEEYYLGRFPERRSSKFRNLHLPCGLKKRETGEKELEIIQTNFSEEPVSRFKKVSKNQTQWLLKRLTLKPSIVIFQDTKENIIKVFREREKGPGTILSALFLLLTYSSQ